MQTDQPTTLNIDIPHIPEEAGVYTFFAQDGRQEIPIYVGESSNVHRRIGEYIVSNFDAPTDFLVGEAIKYLQSKGFRIRVCALLFEGEDKTRKLKQNAIIQEFKDSGFVLLNRDVRHKGYDYHKADKLIERNRIIEFVDLHLLNQ